MSFAPSSPVTGAAQTGLTSPTYTLSADVYPAGVNGKQYAVTTLGGTQTGVRVHSIDSPFTIAMTRPKTVRSAPGAADISNRGVPIPKNEFSVIVRKGVTASSYAATQVELIKMTISVPAGAGLNDEVNLRAALSLLFGTLWANSSAIGDTVVNAVL